MPVESLHILSDDLLKSLYWSLASFKGMHGVLR